MNITKVWNKDFKKVLFLLLNLILAVFLIKIKTFLKEKIEIETLHLKKT